MTHLVLLHKASSIYDDEPDRVYDFPKTYLKAMTEGVGNWIVYYEPVRSGPRGYFAVARLSRIIEKPGAPGRFLALVEAGSYLPFDRPVPRVIDGSPIESALRAPNGSEKRGGAIQLAVRRIAPSEFARIVDMGLPDDLEAQELRRYAPDGAVPTGLADAAATFQRPVTERLTRRAFRDVAFRRQVRRAYDYSCAMSGLRLRNGGGRPEVQAAHIRPVAAQGSDHVRNGLALSGTLHWMFDRGLISVADDNETLLISRNKVPSEVADRLLHPGGKLLRPGDLRDAPHPENLRWHRENVFGQWVPDEPAPWG